MLNHRQMFFFVLFSCCLGIVSGCKTTEANVQKSAHVSKAPLVADPEKIAQARETLGQVATINDRVAETFYQQGLYFEEQGLPDQAVREYLKAIKLRPSFVDLVYTQLGMVYAQSGQYDLAREILENAIAAKPGSALPYYQLALVLMEKRDFANAHMALRKALAINPAMAQANELLQQLPVQRPLINPRATLPAQRAQEIP